jgi:cobalamin biosynthesis protein CobD/CbiB
MGTPRKKIRIRRSTGIVRAARPAPLVEAGLPEARPAAAFCVELGTVRIYAETAADMRAVLGPLLQMASQKNLAQLLGVSTRTLQRWQRDGRVPTTGGHLLAQVVGDLVTRSGSGSSRTGG